MKVLGPEWEAMMKQLIKGLVALIVLGSLIYPIGASTHKERLFPQYTGSVARTNGTSIRMRSYPSQYSEIIDTVDREAVYILGQNEGWYRVKVNSQEGWIAKELIDVSKESFIPYSKVLGEEIVEYGKLFIGTPYVWGGNDLRKGVDCSGLTKEIFEGFDINISRLSYTQVKDGTEVSKSELRPGDLVFFDTSGVNNGQISHVGIYAGDDMFLHADSTRGVMLSSLSSTYYTKNYVTGSRILSDS